MRTQADTVPTGPGGGGAGRDRDREEPRPDADRRTRTVTARRGGRHRVGEFARPAPPPVSVDTREAPDVLARIVVLLLRRQCTVTGVDFVAGDRHRPGRLVIAYDAPAAHADRVAEWLRALVDVLAVESLDA